MATREVTVGNQIYTVDVPEDMTDDEVRAELGIGAAPSAAESRGITGGAPQAGPPSAGPFERQPAAEGVPVRETGSGVETEIKLGPQDEPWQKPPADLNDRYKAFVLDAARRGALTADNIRAWIASNYPGYTISNASDIEAAFKKMRRVNTSGFVFTKPAAIKPEGDLAPLEAGGIGLGKTLTAGALPFLAAGYETLKSGDLSGENLRRQLDIEGAQERGYAEAHPGWTFAGELAGYAAPWTRLGGAPGAAAFGGAQGLSTGYFESGGDPAAALIRAGQEAVIGGGTEKAGSALANRIAQRFRGPAAEVGPGQRAFEAGQDLGIDLPGTLTSPTVASYADRGSRAVAEAEAGAARQTEERLAQLAEQYGVPGAQAPSPFRAEADVGMGEEVVRGASNWLKNMTSRAGKFYDEAKRLSQGAIIPPHETRAAVMSTLQDLSALPNLNQSQINVVRDILSDMTQMPGGVQSLRDMRTALWNRLSGADVALTTSQKGALISKITGALSKDIENGLENLAATTGDVRYQEALNNYKRGDELWRERSGMVENVLSKVLGKDDPNEIIYAANDVWQTNVSPQNAAAVLRRFTTKDHGDLMRLMGTLDADAQSAVRSSLLSTLASNPRGEFNPKTLLTNLAAIPTKTRVALFGNDGVRTLDQLAAVADVLDKPLTGRGSNAKMASAVKLFELLGIGGATVAGGVEGGMTGAAAAAALTGGGAFAANAFASRVLASPALARFAYRLSKATAPGARHQIIAQMTKFAARNPEYRDTVIELGNRAVGVPERMEGPLVGREEQAPEQTEAQDAEMQAILDEAAAAQGGAEAPTEGVAPADGAQGNSGPDVEQFYGPGAVILHDGRVILPDGSVIPAEEAYQTMKGGQ